MTQDDGNLTEVEELWAVDGNILKYKLKPLSGCEWTRWVKGRKMPVGPDSAFDTEWHSAELVSTGAIYTDLRLMNTHAT